MVDASVFPEPRPEDDEDVVWGLSTGSALWARGERGDAIVWLRRAAEAAHGAGQEPRAAELGAAATRMAASPPTLAAAPPGAERLSTDVLVLELDDPTPPKGTPQADAPGEVRAHVALPAPGEATPPMGFQLPAPLPPSPAAPAAAVLQEPPAVPAAPAPVAPPVPAPFPATVSAPFPATVSAPFPAPAPFAAPVPAGPPAPPVAAFVASLPAAATAAPAPPPPVDARPRKKPARGPILDPWSDDPAALASAAQSVRPDRREELVVNVRPRPPGARSHADGEEVVTSAATLDTALKARPQAPRHPPAPRVRRDPAPPGHLAGAEVPAKSAPDDAAGPATPPPRSARTPPQPPPPPIASPPIASPPIASPPIAPPPVASPLVTSTPAASPLITSPLVTSTPVTPPPAAPPEEPPPPAEAAPSTEPTAGAPPEPTPRATSRPPPPERPQIGSVPLDGVDAFADLPTPMQRALAGAARIETIGEDEEVSGFGGALLLDGAAAVCATIVDTPACRASLGALVPTRGTLAEGVALRVVGVEGGATLAIWEQAALDMALKAQPWMLEGLAARADRMQALAGATMGPLGDLGERDRTLLMGRLAVRHAPGGEAIAEAGQPIPGILLVGAGVIELGGGRTMRPGDVVFARELLEDAPAPCAAHAGAGGALLLVGGREIALEAAANEAVGAFLRGES